MHAQTHGIGPAPYRPASEDDARALPPTPLSRRLAIGAAAFVPRGRLAKACFAEGYRRVASGRRPRGIRFELAERIFGEALAVGVDPRRLEFQLLDTVSVGTQSVRLAHWFLDGGDWSQALFPLHASPVRAEVDALFDHEHDLEDAPAFRRLLRDAERGIPQRRNGVDLADLATIRAYFAHYAALKRSIERYGFRSRADLSAAPAQTRTPSAVRGRRAERLEREVGLAIERDGTLRRIVGGHHRTAIAQRLKLPRIPAQVRLVHAGWLSAWIAKTGAAPADALTFGLRHLCLLLLPVVAGYVVRSACELPSGV